MTFEEFCRYGYVSKLSHLRCGGGPSDKVVNAEVENAKAQTEVAKQSQAESAEDRAQRVALTKPLVEKETALAAGDRTAAVTAAMPTISKISAGYDSAKQNILNSMPPGAARDKALADLEVSKATGTSSAMAGMVEKAPEVLANVGQGIGAFSLQELGAAISGYSGASTSNQAAADMQTQQAQAKWTPIMTIASAAGETAGSLWGKKK